MRIDTFSRTEDDNGLLYVFSTLVQKEEEREIRNFRPASAAFNLSFFKKRFLKSNKWIRIVGVFLLFFSFIIIIKIFKLLFDVESFLRKLHNFPSSF